MTARAHLSNVVQFPLDGRPFAQVIEWQLLPVRFVLLDGQQEPVLDKHPAAPWLHLSRNRVSDDQIVFLVESTTCMDGPPARSEIDVRQVETG